MVIVSGSPNTPLVHDRRRIALVDDSLPRQPYHAVAESGWPNSIIEAVAEAARQAVSQALATGATAVGTDVVAVGVVATERRIPAHLDQILRSHAYLHAAEGQLFERAVIEAGHDAGLPIHVVDPGSITVTPAINGLGGSIGPPWQKDHKWATAAALMAVGSG
jgi:hypothetical protein